MFVNGHKYLYACVLVLCLAAGLAAKTVPQHWQVVRTTPDGTRFWIQNGKIHRENGPAIITAEGSKWWVRHNVLHREDGPAVTWPNGGEIWCRNGLLHRNGGPAITTAHGRMGWWIDGKPYRQDAPILEQAPPDKQWGCNGKPLPLRSQHAAAAGLITSFDMAALLDAESPAATTVPR